MKTFAYVLALILSPAAVSSAADPERGILIAVGNGLHRMASNDGITWTNHLFVEKPGHNQNDLKALATGNGVVVAVGGFSKSNILTTRDGVEWHINKFNAGVLSGVVFVKDRFYAFGEGGKVIESADGYAWKLVGDAKVRDHLKAEAEKHGVAEPIKSNIRVWRHAGGRFVGAGDNGFLITTRDFQEWAFPPRIEPRSRLMVESDGTGFVVAGDRTLHHSADGLKWAAVTPTLPDGSKFVSLVHDGQRYLVNARDGKAWKAWSSVDGRAWQPLQGATLPEHIAAVRPDLYYSFSTYWQYTNDLRYSTNGGKTWQSAKIPAPVGVTRVIHAPELPKLK